MNNYFDEETVDIARKIVDLLDPNEVIQVAKEPFHWSLAEDCLLILGECNRLSRDAKSRSRRRKTLLQKRFGTKELEKALDKIATGHDIRKLRYDSKDGFIKIFDIYKSRPVVEDLGWEHFNI